MEPFAVPWWYWIVAGLILVLGELVLPSFFIIWFGLGALVVGVVLVVSPTLSIPTQIGIWVVASVAMTVLWFRLFRRVRERTRAGTADEAIGEVGLLVTEVAPFAHGRVRFQRPILGSDEWPCLSDEVIPVGKRVKVVRIEGSFVKVVRADSSALQQRGGGDV